MKKKLALIFLIITIFMASCSNNDTSSLILESYDPPQWEGITIGSSTRTELLSFLTTSEMIKTDTIAARGKQWNSFDDIINFTLISGELGQAYIQGDRVVLIEISNLKHITIAEMSEIYGYPQRIYVHGVLGKGFLFGDTLHVLIEGFYPEKGVIFGYDSYSLINWQPRKITPGKEIDWIDYFSSNDYEMLIKSGIFSLGPTITETDFHPWKGFGNIDELYPRGEE